MHPGGRPRVSWRQLQLCRGGFFPSLALGKCAESFFWVGFFFFQFYSKAEDRLRPTLAAELPSGSLLPRSSPQQLGAPGHLSRVPVPSLPLPIVPRCRRGCGGTRGCRRRCCGDVSGPTALRWVGGFAVVPTAGRAKAVLQAAEGIFFSLHPAKRTGGIRPHRRRPCWFQPPGFCGAHGGWSGLGWAGGPPGPSAGEPHRSGAACRGTAAICHGVINERVRITQTLPKSHPSLRCLFLPVFFSNWSSSRCLSLGGASVRTGGDAGWAGEEEEAKVVKR